MSISALWEYWNLIHIDFIVTNGDVTTFFPKAYCRLVLLCWVSSVSFVMCRRKSDISPCIGTIFMRILLKVGPSWDCCCISSLISSAYNERRVLESPLSLIRIWSGFTVPDLSTLCAACREFLRAAYTFVYHMEWEALMIYCSRESSGLLRICGLRILAYKHSVNARTEVPQRKSSREQISLYISCSHMYSIYSAVPFITRSMFSETFTIVIPYLICKDNVGYILLVYLYIYRLSLPEECFMQYHGILERVMYVLYQSSVSNVNRVRATVQYYFSTHERMFLKQKCLDDF